MKSAEPTETGIPRSRLHAITALERDVKSKFFQQGPLENHWPQPMFSINSKLSSSFIFYIANQSTEAFKLLSQPSNDTIFLSKLYLSS